MANMATGRATGEGATECVCDTSPLSIDDLQEVFEATYEARDKWRNLGGVVGVPESTLRCIAKEEADEDGKLRRVISTWLETHGGTSRCSWNAVAQALKNSRSR